MQLTKVICCHNSHLMKKIMVTRFDSIVFVMCCYCSSFNTMVFLMISRAKKKKKNQKDDDCSLFTKRKERGMSLSELV